MVQHMHMTRSSHGSRSNHSRSMGIEKKLISHVPDLVVFDKNPGKIPHVLKFDGVLMFADVSGFTALTERYTMYNDNGTDALTVTLNNYIGKIVKNILQAGGDVLKFAGDAILAVWKVKDRPDLTHAVSQAAKCSLAIQEKCDNQDTDVGVQLRVKIAISAGKIYATFVGNNHTRHFVMAGRPVREVNAAEKYCQAGLVVLSPNAMELSDKDNIINEPLGERFGLVKYLRREPRKEWCDYIDIPKGLKFTKNADDNIRISLGIRSDHNRELVVRQYITPVVQRKLDDDQPLKFLSEMRQCSILFINLAFELNERDKLFHEKQCVNMQAAFTIVNSTISDMQGSLNKIFMFDKGCTFLVIFGLPGDKHEQEPAHALQASWKICQEMNENLPTLNLASFGVTTGPVFCGVIGHEERHEYTVIGQKVNLAARLMMHYPNMVSCDFETYNDSKLSKDMFKRLPHKAMKGVGNVIVYNYTEGERKLIGTATVDQPEFPIIGREGEIELFVEELRRLKESQLLGRERRVIIFEAEAGYGKTRVMKEIQWRAACEEVRVIAFTLSINDLNTPFFAVKALLDLLLGTVNSEERCVKEQALMKAVSSNDCEELCLLNEIMMINFPISHKVSQMVQDAQTKALHNLLVRIVHKMTANQFVLFALDDAQNVDNESWKFLTTLSKDSRALCALAMRPFSPDKPPSDCAKQVIYHPKTMHVMLRALINEHLTPLACQLLHVKKIPLQLEHILIQRSHGVPLWCEQLLREMQNAGIILILPMSERRNVGLCETTCDEKVEDVRNDDAIESNQPVIKQESATKENPSLSSWTNRIRWQQTNSKGKVDFCKHSVSNDNEILQMSQEKHEDDEIPMECVVKPNFDLAKFPVPASIRGMALARLDRLKPFEQLVVKSAAVIGGNMSRKMLKAVVPGFSEDKFHDAMFQLMYSRVFECASSTMEKRELAGKQSLQFVGQSCRIMCFCQTNNNLSATGGHERTEHEIAARCEQLRFHNSLVQETAYKLWLQDQRRTLHDACANFLEGKINEVLITGYTDDVITKQFRLSQRQCMDEITLNTELMGKVEKSSDSMLKTQQASPNSLAAPKGNQRRISHGSVIGRLNSESVGSQKSISKPLQLQESVMPMDLLPISERDAKSEQRGSNDNDIATQSRNSNEPDIIIQLPTVENENAPLPHKLGVGYECRRMTYGPLWSQAVGLPATYERTLNNTEEQAKCLPVLAVNKILCTPFEIHDNLALLYEQLVDHSTKASNTEKTINSLLRAAESSVASLNLGKAYNYLQKSSEIVDNLDKGLDIISNFTEDDDLNVEDLKVLSVSKDTKATIQKLLGEVLFQQGKLEESLAHFFKALKILHCWLPRNYILINALTWIEKRRQNSHIKKPSRYIGSASSKLANRYVEQVRCLSYICQILLNLKRIPHRMKLSQLVALMQVNRSESADDDLPELITSYTYMMQLRQLTGDLSQSVLYESKATARCMELPTKLTLSDLHIIGHLHLVSCSVRLCHGKLEHATTSGYRAYNVADSLGDTDIKLIVLPLLAQIHLLTGRGRACVEVLNLLLHISNSNNDDLGVSSYYITCLDLILDAGYSLENALTCVDYMQSTESIDLGNVQRFYIRTSMAVWCYRRNEIMKGRACLKLASQLTPSFFDNFLAVRAYTRFVEACLLAYSKIKETLGSYDKETKQAGLMCKDSLKKLRKLCKQFPVFSPRSLHLNAFYHLLSSKSNKVCEYIAQSINMARYCGNIVDYRWATHNQSVWLSQRSFETSDTDFWINNCEEMPDWETANKNDHVERNYTFKVA